MATKKTTKLHVRKGDMVRIISGEDKGREGRVLVVDTEKQRAIVEGVNIIHRHTKPNATHPNGAIVKKEAPIYTSKLMVIAGGEPSRLGRKVVDGKLKRYSVKTGEIID